VCRVIPFKNGEQVDWAIPSLLPDEKRHGKQGILFLDEITSAPPTVSAAAYQLILDRRLGVKNGLPKVLALNK
jgi:MoxR-like ATPase